MSQYYVYIMASRSQVLYIGVTNHLARRVAEHKTGEVAGFTQRYKVNRLVYFESSTSINAAISREKQLKGWTRSKKIRLIESDNPNWEDLSLERC